MNKVLLSLLVLMLTELSFAGHMCEDFFVVIKELSVVDVKDNKKQKPEKQEGDLPMRVDSFSQVEQLAKLKLRFGRQFQMSKVPYETWAAHERWYKFEEFEIALMDNPNGYGTLFFRTLDESQYYSLDASLPLADKIIDEVMLSQPPEGFSLSQDGNYYVVSGNQVLPVNKISSDLIYDLIGEGSALPTPQKLNAILGLSRNKSPAYFVANANKLFMPKEYYHLELAERMAKGEIPISLSDTYAFRLDQALQVMKLAQSCKWTRYRKLLSKALQISKNQALSARTRYQGRQEAWFAQVQLFKYFLNYHYQMSYDFVMEKEDWNRQTPEIEAIVPRFNTDMDTIEKRLNKVDLKTHSPTSAPKEKGDRLALTNDQSNSRGIFPQVRSIFISVVSKLGSLLNINGGESNSILLSPDDLLMIINDWKFYAVYKNHDQSESHYLDWLKEQITRSDGTSGSSMQSERIDLKIWVYRQYPELLDIEIPSDLSGETGAIWLRNQIEKVLGANISIAIVDHGDANAYNDEALKRFANMLRSEAFWDQISVGGKNGPHFNFDNQNISEEVLEAFKTLGLNSDSDFNAIRYAYRKRSMALHPDRKGDTEFFKQKMQAINKAYDLLELLFKP